MKRRSNALPASADNWLVVQWEETVRSLQARPASRRGQMVISDEALANCLENISSGIQMSSDRRSERDLIAAS